MTVRLVFIFWVITLFLADSCEAGSNVPPTHSGYSNLLDQAYLPPDFSQEIWEKLWENWEEPAKSAYQRADKVERRRLMFERYGFTETPGQPDRELPLQYSPDGKGGWVMNCFTCHGGKVNGEVIPGLPNTHIALQTLIDDVRMIKLRERKKFQHMDLGSLVVPLGTTRGTTNAVIFGVALGALRDPDLTYRPSLNPPPMLHHDMDAPPWWNVMKKSHLYADGFAPRSHRSLMQFLMVPENGPKEFTAFEPAFEQIYEYIGTLQPPKYPFPIDQTKATRGEVVFNNTCAECHGTYGKESVYETVNVPIDVVGTDRARYDALGTPGFVFYEKSWFNGKSKDKVNTTPAGYVAPPLDGVWASAPYFHNGAVPTLWHVLHSSDRPVVWKRSEDGYDRNRVGLEVQEMSVLPTSVTSNVAKRYYFDTTKFGKSAAGHTFPDKLSEQDRADLLEYLKTL